LSAFATFGNENGAAAIGGEAGDFLLSLFVLSRQPPLATSLWWSGYWLTRLLRRLKRRGKMGESQAWADARVAVRDALGNRPGGGGDLKLVKSPHLKMNTSHTKRSEQC